MLLHLVKVYLTKQLNEIQKYNDDNIFINQQLLSHFYSIENPEVLEEFEKGCLIVIEIINYVFKYLNDNISTIHVPLAYGAYNSPQFQAHGAYCQVPQPEPQYVGNHQK